MDFFEIDSVILEFENHRVLQDIYLKIETGKVTGLLGRNGSGKSSLMKIIFGEINPTDKSLRINGNPIYDNYRKIEDFRFLPQFNFIPKNLTIKRIFSDFNSDFKIFLNYFPEFENLKNYSIHRLSGGEKRIIEIFLIVNAKTKFCILDEPFSQISPKNIDTIKELIKNEKKNKGILITDHLDEHIIDLQDSLYIIKNGKTYLTKSIQDIETLEYANLKKIG